MTAENSILLKTPLFEMSATGQIGIVAIVVLVVLWFIGRIVVNRLRG